jgi:hypothetical protein
MSDERVIDRDGDTTLINITQLLNEIAPHEVLQALSTHPEIFRVANDVEVCMTAPLFVRIVLHVGMFGALNVCLMQKTSTVITEEDIRTAARLSLANTADMLNISTDSLMQQLLEAGVDPSVNDDSIQAG